MKLLLKDRNSGDRIGIFQTVTRVKDFGQDHSLLFAGRLLLSDSLRELRCER